MLSNHTTNIVYVLFQIASWHFQEWKFVAFSGEAAWLGNQVKNRYVERFWNTLKFLVNLTEPRKTYANPLHFTRIS